ncbi:unnamed protein product [Linum trigynum]|uniref:non-specific serine/threonine protein kinase n=1 Tax=Linum trigynum TaxID=586398 RepID=A0AAV2DKH3_9ROSI
MGAHVAGHARAIKTTALLFLLSLATTFLATAASLQSDALLKFKAGLGDNDALGTWDPAVDPCNNDRSNWAGVLCSAGAVWGLQLEHMQLSGVVDVDALAAINNIRTLSLMDNRLDGPLPEVKKLGKLKTLFLSNNYFSGEIPAGAFDGMGSLKTLHLANNDFTGRIPASIAVLPKLTMVRLDGNQFEGRIPDFQQKFLRAVNVANNELEGPIPKSLSHMNPNSFSGNKGLCGAPLQPCAAPPPSLPPPPPPFSFLPAAEAKLTNLTLEIIIGLLILVIILIATILCLILLHHRRRRNSDNPLTRNPSSVTATKVTLTTPPAVRFVQREASHLSTASAKRAEQQANNNSNRLLFLRDDVERFDLQDLLRASAEVLGSGTFGASYKAGVVGQAMVVKRYRHMNNVGREEFHEHMRRVGRLKHPNLLPVEAYYYRKEEKLLVSKFVEHGSLASHLHGKHSSGQGLDWATRVKIIRGIAKGLAYLYEELPLTLPHGHLKSSNVLLSDAFEPMLTDYALRPVVNADHAHKLMIAYKSPEYAQHGKTSNKTDVWSLGIVVLEILTGKFPENYLTQGYDGKADLGTWVNDMVKEKKMGEVFDRDMAGTNKDSKSQMIHLLQLALSCCEEDLERRVDVKEAVERIEQYVDTGV